MRYSRLFGKTCKNVDSEITLQSHRLLFQGGFIRESTAGRYYFLPLGMQVQDKIVAIIEEEMNRVGAQKLITPILHPLELWKETNRTSSVGFELMKVADQRGMEFALGGTAEEMMVDLVRGYTMSYKDLPFHIYQFSQKFRDERRARGGLLRTREFLMKDSYSFHENKEDFEREYKVMWETYSRIFERMGLTTIAVESDNGYIGGEYCHEFVVVNDVGESKFLYTEDGSYAAHEDVAVFDRGVMNPDEEIKAFQIIEQPAWVQSMEDNEKHYRQPRWRFLKNVVYRNRGSGEIIIAGIRGDLDVNKTKLENALNAVGELEDASVDDLKAIGTKPGYVHSWGHRGARYIGDFSLQSVRNFIGGQKEETTDSTNVNYGRDFECEILADIALAQEQHRTKDGKTLLAKRGIEVGNIFQLGTHYSDRMAGAVFTTQENREQPYYMGCYGIGVGRTMATIVETHNDEHGIVWPESVAPYHVHLLSLGNKPQVRDAADTFYRNLSEHGIEVLYDDREESAGTKLHDADLIGIPNRVIISEKTLTKKSVEYKQRASGAATLITNKKALETVASRKTNV